MLQAVVLRELSWELALSLRQYLEMMVARFVVAQARCGSPLKLRTVLAHSHLPHPLLIVELATGTK